MVDSSDVTVDETSNILTLALPTGLSASYPTIDLTWASGDYSGNTLTISDYQIKNEISDLQLWIDGSLAGDKAVYQNDSSTFSYTATGTIVNGSASNNKTSTSIWNSSDTGVATVSGGVVSIVGAGTTTISATYDGQTDSISFTVFGPTSISVTDSSSSIKIAEDIQLVATAIYGDGTSEVITNNANWTASNSNITLSSITKGLVTGSSVGEATVTATYGGQSGTYPMVVTNIDVSPTTIQTLEAGVRVIKISGIDTSIGLSNISISVGGISVTPVIDNGYFAFTVPSGISSGVNAVNITAGGNEYVSSISVLSSTISLSKSIVSVGYDTFNMVISSKNIDLDDSTNKPSIVVGTNVISASNVTINESDDTITFPLSSGLDAASYNITLTFSEGKYLGHTIQDQFIVAKTIEFSTEGSSSLNVGTSIDLLLTAFDGTNTVDITSSVGWESSDTSVATVQNGRVQGISSGTATITVTYEGQSVTKLIIVNDTSSSSTDSSSDKKESSGGVYVPIVSTDTTLNLADEVLNNIKNASTQDAKSDVVTLSVNAAETLKDKTLSDVKAQDLTRNVFDAVGILLSKENLSNSDIASATQDTSKVIQSLVERKNLDPEVALKWSNSMIDDIAIKTFTFIKDDAKLSTKVSEDILDNVIVNTISLNISSKEAQNLMEKFVDQTASVAIKSDKNNINSGDLKDKLVKVAENVVTKLEQ